MIKLPNDHAHCWHMTEPDIEHFMQRTVDVCCWCGAIRRTLYFNGTPAEHGPYLGRAMTQPRIGPREYKETR